MPHSKNGMSLALARDIDFLEGVLIEEGMIGA